MPSSKYLSQYTSQSRAEISQRFFKTGKGQYGEGDVFIGVTVPDVRIVAKQYKDLSLEHIEKLLKSKIHEDRLLALLILVEQFKKGTEAQQKSIARFYLAQLDRVNNWDLVDLSADKILGAWLYERSRTPLYKLVRSKNLWERRVAIISTFYFIRHHDFKDTLRLAEMLLNDQHDLMHKAVGWMLREVGKRDEAVLLKFLDKHAIVMPRTALRYALERLPEAHRKYYLKLQPTK